MSAENVELTMSFMDRLLDGVDVEWVDLGDVAKYEQPTKYLVESSVYDNKFKIPVLTAGKTFILGYTNEVKGVYPASKNPVIIFDDFTTANKWVDFDFKAKSSAMKMISSKNEGNVLLKYIFYWLNTLPNDLVSGDHMRYWIGTFTKKKIPVPSLAIQSEIVRILDAFTTLTAELTAELTARKKQYAYYRDQLLSFEGRDDVEWVELGDLTTIKTGPAVNKQIISANPGVYPVINSGREPLGFINKWNVDDDPICIASRGSVGLITWMPGKFFRGNLNYSASIKNKNILSQRYLYHALLKFQQKIYDLCTFDGIPALNACNLKQLMVPVPPLAEQNRIVALLDKFDTLTASITEGLPNEIALRQKQYEHYRNLLFSFPKPDQSPTP